MPKVFICYSRNDEGFVKQLTEDLEECGVTIWIDREKMGVGDPIVRSLSAAIDQVDYVVAVLSAASLTSHWARFELENAVNREVNERRVIVLPVVLDGSDLPPFLRDKNYADSLTKTNGERSSSDSRLQ